MYLHQQAAGVERQFCGGAEQSCEGTLLWCFLFSIEITSSVFRTVASTNMNAVSSRSHEESSAVPAVWR